jgi:hypothetical protein
LDANAPILIYEYSFGPACGEANGHKRHSAACARGSAPGLKFNNVAPLFMVKDRKSLRRWFADEFHKAPPAWLIPAHGDVVDFTANPDARRSLFGAG